MTKTTDLLQQSIDGGWSIQIYSRDRRLLCSLYPSHGWVLLVGVALGFMFALVSVNDRPVPQADSTAEVPEAPNSESRPTPLTIPFQLD